MVDLFAHPDAREAFQKETEEMANLDLDLGDDGVVPLRKLLTEEPMAILYCVNGTYVKASPSILKTTNGTDDAVATVQMRETVQKSYREHLAAANISGDLKKKYYGAAEVRSRVGACVCS